MEGDSLRNGNRFISSGAITPLSLMQGRPHPLAYKYENERIDNGGMVRPETARRLIDALESATTTEAIFDAWQEVIGAGLAEWKDDDFKWQKQVYRLIGRRL